MRWDRVLTLVAVRYSADHDGNRVPSERRRTVFANELSVGARSYYEAGQSGHHPVARLQVRACDYSGEGYAIYEGRRLAVTRADGSSPDLVTIDLEEEAGTR